MRNEPRGKPVDLRLAKPVIPVIGPIVREQEALLAAADVIFLQGGELPDLPEMLDWLRRGALARIRVMLHIDLLAGLSSDEAGLRYVAGLERIDGIITVRSHLVAAARRLGLASILRLFLQDGRALDRGLHIIEQCEPDLVELIPGVAAIETAAQFEHVRIPRIAGGLVRTAELVRRIVESGCRAVSTSSMQLWQLNRPNATLPPIVR